MDLKRGLEGMHEGLAELESLARKLPNQNIADVLKSAMAKLLQASQHPDLDKVAEQLHKEAEAERGPGFPFDHPISGS